LSRCRHHYHHHHLLLLLLRCHLHHILIVLTACKFACYILFCPGNFMCKIVCELEVYICIKRAQLYKVTCCIQNDRSSISGLVECLPLFHVNPKSVSNQLLMLDYFCWDVEQWLHMALKLSKAVFECCLLRTFVWTGIV